MLVGHDLQVAKHYKEWLTEVGCKYTRHLPSCLILQKLMLSDQSSTSEKSNSNGRVTCGHRTDI